jgi:hypothetical protein
MPFGVASPVLRMNIRQRELFKVNQMKKWFPFVASISLYALIMLIASILPDYRHGLAIVLILGALTQIFLLFCVLKPSKAKTTALLIAALLFLPLGTSRGDESSTGVHKENTVVVGCVVLVVGGIIIYSIWKLCKMIPPVQGGTNAPPAGQNQQHNFGPVLASPMRLNMPAGTIPAGSGWQTSVISFQSTTNSIYWKDEYTVTNWLSDNQLVSLCVSNGVPLLTNFVALSWTNETVFSDLSSVLPDQTKDRLKLWRAVQH